MYVAVGISDRWKVTCDRWNLTYDMWHVTYDTWHMIKKKVFKKCQKSFKKCNKKKAKSTHKCRKVPKRWDFIVLVLLSAHGERVGVSCMQEFHWIGPLGRFNLVVAMSVCLSVCVCVCLSPFHVVDFEAYFAPTFPSWMSKFLEIRNPWGKVLERSGLRTEHFCWKMV